MKRTALSFLFFLGFISLASPQAYEGTIQYNKKKQRAIMIDYAYPPEAVENAMVLKMGKLGYKPKEEKGLLNKDRGFLIFKNAYVTDISNDRMDYMIKVERKSRKESDEAILYVVMMRNDLNVLDKLDAYDLGRSKSFLNNMIPDIESANLELQIKAQEEIVAKAEKKLTGLKKDKEELEKKLSDNEKDQENTEKDIEQQKQNLETLRSKRKGSW